MTRFLSVIVLTGLLTGPAAAQDVPPPPFLSTVSADKWPPYETTRMCQGYNALIHVCFERRENTQSCRMMWHAEEVTTAEAVAPWLARGAIRMVLRHGRCQGQCPPQPPLEPRIAAHTPALAAWIMTHCPSYGSSPLP